MELILPNSWTANGIGVSFEDGLIIFDPSADGSTAFQDMPSEVADIAGPYLFSVTVDSITQGTVSLSSYGLAITAPGTYTIPVSFVFAQMIITTSLSDAVISSVSLVYLTDAQLGAELAANGAFDASFGWTLDAQWRIADGMLQSFDDMESSYAVSDEANIETGSLYRMIFTVTGVDTGPIIKIETGPDTYEDFDGDDHTVNGTVTKTLYVVAEDTGNLAFNNQATIFDIDNVSLRKYTLP